METYRFKVGDVCHLDEVYKIMGLLPESAFLQDDPSDPSGDGGESITFLKNVEISVIVKVTDPPSAVYVDEMAHD